MRLRARGKIHQVFSAPILPEFLYEEETEKLLYDSTSVVLTEKQMEEAMSYAVQEYERQLITVKERLLNRFCTVLDKIIP